MSKTFEIRYYKDFLKDNYETLYFIQCVGTKKTIKDVFDFIVEKKLPTNEPVCYCMLNLKREYLTFLGTKHSFNDYQDKTNLDETRGIISIEKFHIYRCKKLELIKLQSQNLLKDQRIREFESQKNREKIAFDLNYYSYSYGF